MQVDEETINNAGLSRIAAPALITEQTSGEEVCCLVPTLHIFDFNTIKLGLSQGADIRSLKVKFQQSPRGKQ